MNYVQKTAILVGRVQMGPENQDLMGMLEHLAKNIDAEEKNYWKLAYQITPSSKQSTQLHVSIEQTLQNQADYQRLVSSAQRLKTLIEVFEDARIQLLDRG